MPSVGYYAVQAGRQPGVYTTWNDCEAQVKGFQGAKYQKFRIREEAENFVHANTSFTAPATQHPSAPPFVQGPAILRTVPEPESEQGWTVIYTDGACKGNGKESAVAGVGVWFGDSHPKNHVERCPGDQTNNRAELIAIIRALELTSLQEKVVIKTDSAYCQKCIESWLPTWRLSNFKTSSGDAVKNLPLILYLSELLGAKPPRTFRFVKVLAHSGIHGNECADGLANQGCLKPWRVESEDEWDLAKVESRQSPGLGGGDDNSAVRASGSLPAPSPVPIPDESESAASDISMFTADDLLDDDDLAAEMQHA